MDRNPTAERDDKRWTRLRYQNPPCWKTLLEKDVTRMILPAQTYSRNRDGCIKGCICDEDVATRNQTEYWMSYSNEVMHYFTAVHGVAEFLYFPQIRGQLEDILMSVSNKDANVPGARFKRSHYDLARSRG